MRGFLSRLSRVITTADMEQLATRRPDGSRKAAPRRGGGGRLMSVARRRASVVRLTSYIVNVFVGFDVVCCSRCLSSDTSRDSLDSKVNSPMA